LYVLTPTPTLRFIVVVFCSALPIYRYLKALLLTVRVCDDCEWGVAWEITRHPRAVTVSGSR
jgi:hypothetical protein